MLCGCIISLLKNISLLLHSNYSKFLFYGFNRGRKTIVFLHSEMGNNAFGSRILP